MHVGFDVVTTPNTTPDGMKNLAAGSQHGEKHRESGAVQ